ncbi:T9SS type A sorting domain-containing protein [Patiriisocius hiemis]|uniref:T9SS type A sorting domain-containing protein n=1 Tax=Patiriisocius hiemis TaxID=3075604 RepID=A0ABU2YEN8_9FLAO|nr:T9SS type A sorting domain-containing protein [Constantimarinum sp. W242]MDT0556656.1 T9SS type A sorting domain-containing protein [Constantimarinum sp. W242]
MKNVTILSAVAVIACLGLILVSDILGTSINSSSLDDPNNQKKELIVNKLTSSEYEEIPAVCFAPGTRQEYIDQFYSNRNPFGNSLQLSSEMRFNLAGRWQSTATDGGGLGQGDVTTLTWSYVPDGTAIGNGGCQVPGESSSGSDFIAFFNGIYGPPTTAGDFTTAPWHQLFVDMFTSWSDVSGLNFVYEPNDDGATNVSTAGQLGVRGDMRISGRALDGNSGVLACNYFPNAGDMIIDTSDNFFDNNDTTNGNFNVLAHEIGHGIGLLHVCPVEGSKLMEPFVNISFFGQQEDDILGVNRHYGDFDGTNDSSAESVLLGSNALPTTYDVIQRSIDDNSEVDFFSFTISEAATFSGTLSPTGTTYLEGVQFSSGACSSGSPFNAQTISNLEFELLGTNGTTILATGSGNGAGVDETISNFTLPLAGTYFVRVSQEGSSVDNVQMYDLSIDLVATTPINTAPSATAPSAPTVNEDDIDVALANNIQVNDAEVDSQVVSFTITGGALTIGTTGITFGGSGNGSASFTASGTLVDINSALDAATFTPTPDLNGTNAGSISFISNDGLENSNTATVTFDIAAVNDDPTITSLPSDISVLENVASDVDLSQAQFTDIDSGSNAIDLTITAGQGDLAAASVGGVTVGGSGGTLILTGSETAIDNYLNTASNIQYTGPVGLSGDDATTLTLVANDGGNSGSGGGLDVTLGTVNVDISSCTISISCPANVTVQCDESTDPANTGTATSSGTCTSQSISFTDSVASSTGVMTITRTWTVTSSSGAPLECDQIITVEDNDLPSVVCQDITVQLDATGNATIVASQIDNGSTDNCGIDTITIDVTSFSCSDLGTNNVTLTVTDSFGNVDTCIATVTVEDNIDPEFNQSSLPDDMEVVADSGTGVYTLEDFTVGVIATDNCDATPSIVLEQNPLPGTELGLGVFDITLTAIDGSLNDVDYTFELTVVEVLGVEEKDLSTLQLVPNPIQNKLSVLNPQLLELDSISIYDLAGRLVTKENFEISTSEKTVDLTQLDAGMYLAIITSGEKQMVTQLIKK